ncbi:unnamed protein product [Thlaspi arvense]|uniref:BED-type domain-containing protein n=1 Tax=Thlaspi arvense TaxID=13288 RepID=A0AAU9S1Z1_THLAR|nr:unnamed protein product [Thlaspi arvense]
MNLNSGDDECLRSVDFESQKLINSLNAEEERANADGGSQPRKVRKKRFIQVEDVEDDSETEHTPKARLVEDRRKSSQLNKRKPQLVDIEDDDAETEFTPQSRKRNQDEVRNRKQQVFDGESSQPNKKKKKIVDSDSEDESNGESDVDDKGKSSDKKRESRKWSAVWNDFVVITKEDGSQKAQCKHCKKEYKHQSHKNGTATLGRHSKRCSLTPRTSGDIGNMMINTEAKLQARKIDHLVFREMVAKTIIQHDLPFAYVEYERVRAVWKYLNADVKFISRNTAAADVYRFYEDETANLKMELASLPGRISFTSDLWPAITHEGYVCLTAH